MRVGARNFIRRSTKEVAARQRRLGMDREVPNGCRQRYWHGAGKTRGRQLFLSLQAGIDPIQRLRSCLDDCLPAITQANSENRRDLRRGEQQLFGRRAKVLLAPWGEPLGPLNADHSKSIRRWIQPRIQLHRSLAKVGSVFQLSNESFSEEIRIAGPPARDVVTVLDDEGRSVVCSSPPFVQHTWPSYEVPAFA
jgi:hypothetical protein